MGNDDRSEPEVKQALNLADLFDRDEHITDIDPEWSEEELVSHDGVFAFSKVIDALGLDKKRIREFAKKEDQAGVDIYEEYGLKKMEGSQWRIRMKTFRDKLESFRDSFRMEAKEENIQNVPNGISREKFFKLRGKFKLKEVIEAGYLPYDMREISGILKKEKIKREESGCWKGAKDWYVDFVPFILFVFSRYKGLPLEKVKKKFSQP